jgi:hypothetical protein
MYDEDTDDLLFEDDEAATGDLFSNLINPKGFTVNTQNPITVLESMFTGAGPMPSFSVGQRFAPSQSFSASSMSRLPPGVTFSPGPSQPVFQAGPFQSGAIPSIPGLIQHIGANSALNQSLATATQTAQLAAAGLVQGPYGPYNPNNLYDPNNPNNPNSPYNQFGGGGGGGGGFDPGDGGGGDPFSDDSGDPYSDDGGDPFMDASSMDPAADALQPDIDDLSFAPDDMMGDILPKHPPHRSRLGKGKWTPGSLYDAGFEDAKKAHGG